MIRALKLLHHLIPPDSISHPDQLTVRDVRHNQQPQSTVNQDHHNNNNNNNNNHHNHNNESSDSAFLNTAYPAVQQLQQLFQQQSLNRDSSSSSSSVTCSLSEWLKKESTVLGYSSYYCFSQAHLDTFSILTGDRQWIHTEAATELGSPFGGPIAHGFLTLSFITQIVQQVVPQIEGVVFGVNFGLDKLRFIKPVPVNRRFRGKVTLQSVKELSNKGEEKGQKGIQNELFIEIFLEGEQNNKPAMIATWVTRLYLK